MKRDNAESHLTRRDFLQITSVPATLTLLGSSTLIVSCGDDPASIDDENGPGITPFVLMTNPTDPLLLRATGSDGSVAEYYGARDGWGLPMAVDRILVTQGLSVERFELAANGLPSRIGASNGVQLQFNWLSSNRAALTILSPDGSYQVNTEIDFSVNPPLQAPRPPASASTEPRRLPQRSSPSGGLDFKPFQSDNGLPVVGGGEVSVTVTRCGAPDPTPASVNVVVRDVTGAVLHHYPAEPTGLGRYRVTLPSDVNPSVGVADLCESVAGALGWVCAGVEGLGPAGGTVLCAGIATAITAAGGAVPALLAAQVAAACQGIVVALEFYCVTLGSDPSGRLAEAICQGTFQDRRITADVSVEAYVVALPSNVHSSRHTVGPADLAPALTIDLGGETAIRTLTLAPPSPAGGVGYQAQADVFCVPAGSNVTVSVLGTDGYEDSDTYLVSAGQVNGTYTLFVPGGASGVRDQVTVRVVKPSGQVLERVASLVFG